jgi:hypothetical protein
MSLSSAQQPYADALVKAFGDFMTAVGGAYVAPVTTPGQGPGTPFGPAPGNPFGPVPVPAPAPVAGWWNPTPAQYAAFAARFGLSTSEFSPVSDATDATGKFLTLPPVTATADILEYAGYGYGPDGEQRLFHVGKFAAARAACDAIYAATVPGQEDAVVKGAEAPGVEPDAVRLSCMTGLVVFGPLGNAQMAGGQTVADVVAILLQQNTTAAGQGPATGF